MALVKAPLVAGFLAALLALLATGCGERRRKGAAAAAAAKPPAPHCADPAGWQKLANRIAAAVYCPGWLPDPLTSQIGGRWNNIDSVCRDRSYLESFVWQETGRRRRRRRAAREPPRLPGRTTIPTCRTGGLNDSRDVPCFARRAGTSRRTGSRRRVYTVNQDADRGTCLLRVAPQGRRSTRSPSTSRRRSTTRKPSAYLKRELALARPASAVELDVKLTRQAGAGRRGGRRRRRRRDLRARRPARRQLAERADAAVDCAPPSSTCSTGVRIVRVERASRCSCRRCTTRS